MPAKLKNARITGSNFESSVVFNAIARKLLSGETGQKHLGRRLYDYAWVYSVYIALELSGNEILDKIRQILRSLLSNESEFYNVLYDSQGSAGLLFSLYHLLALDREKGNNDFRYLARRALMELKQLQWHDNDGKILAFSLLLSTKLDGDTENEVKSIIDKLVDEWIDDSSYYALQNLAYLAFSYSYARKGEELFSLLVKMGLIEESSLMLKRILNISDPELLALVLYALGTLAYEDIIHRKIKERSDSAADKRLINHLRLEKIPDLARNLDVVIKGLNIGDNHQSVPPNLIAKIHLAKIQSGLDSPFFLSRYEWRVYNQIRIWLVKGYLKVKQTHLLITFLVDALIPIVIIHVLYPLYDRLITQTPTLGPLADVLLWLLLIFIPIIFSINLNLVILKEGEITKRNILWIFTLVWRELYNAIIRRG